MATNTYYVNVANDDWTISSSFGRIDGASTISASNNKVIFPNDSTTAYADVLTSGIGTDIISGASVIFDEYSYNTSRGLTKTYALYMHNGSYYTLIQSYTFGRSAVVRTKILNATQIGYINKTGKTKFRITVTGTVSAGQSKTLLAKAYETSQANAFRMSITHAPLATDIPQRTLMGVGI
jgi:hypothetical protein